MCHISFDGVATIDELMWQRARSHSASTLISYQIKENEFVEFTGASLEHLTASAAQHYAAKLNLHHGNPPVKVALVGQSSLEYYIAFLALQRAGCTTAFISPRLADQGFEHLLKTTRCVAAVVAGSSMSTMERVISNLESKVDLISLLAIDDISTSITTECSKMTPSADENLGQEFIIHSGGSTGLPKPVPLKPESWLRQAGDIAARMPRVDALTTLPLFHSFGLATLLRCLVNGKKLTILNADRPITASGIVSALDATGSEALVTVPYILKFFTEMEGGVARLAQLKQVIAAGSAIPDELGDHLVASGVNIFHLYGQTESGALMEPSSDQWNWVTPLPHAEPYLRFEPTNDGLYHLVVLPGLKAKVYSTREDGSYETKDLFQRHPTDLRKWKFAARQDDIIVLVNGEKADPVPLETALCQNSYVRAAVAFGAQRESLGLLVFLSDNAAALSKEDVLSSIVPDLQKGNSRVPAYAKVPTDALILKPAETELSCTDKGTVIRSRVIKQFESEIAEHYASREQGSTSGGVAKDEDVSGIVQAAVLSTLSLSDEVLSSFTDTSDFFALGMDSLQASNVRSKLSRQIGTTGQALPTNVVFEHPNLESLTNYLLEVRKGNNSNPQSRHTLAQELIRKYAVSNCADSPMEEREPLAMSGAAPASEKQDQCILLTGATGFVGAHILHKLLLNPNVTKVYCLVRAADTSAAHKRIKDSLSKSYLLDDLSSETFAKVSAHSSDFSALDLGLSLHLQDKFRSNVTHIIHNAWQVNFNLSLRSFEEQSIRPTAFLLSLAASSRMSTKPVFTFISSIAVALRHPAGKTSNGIGEALVEWDAVEAMGYAESKFVGEQIVAAAAQEAGVLANIVRLGQVCGDTVHGYWNPAEAIPRTVQTANTIGKLPMFEDGDEELDWTPVNIVAGAVVKLSLSDSAEAEGLKVFHVVNKRRLRWNAEFLPALKANGLVFEAVPGKDWVKALEESGLPVERNPALQLLAFFKQKYGALEVRQPPVFDVKESARIAAELSEGYEIDAKAVGKFLRHWSLAG